MKAVLSLALELASGDEVNCAKALRAQLPPDRWQILRQLAFEVTAIGESEAAGTRMLVVPASEASVDQALASLRLRQAG